MIKLKLFIFHDGIEELVVVAKGREDAFIVINETCNQYTDDPASDLIMSQLTEYPDDFQFDPDSTAKTLVNKYGRGLLSRGKPGKFKKPEKING